MFKQITLEQVQNLYSTPIKSRYQDIIDTFLKEYGTKPDFIARAPGRVNIIGEHIDYEGYGVLPAAIEKDCLIAVKVSQIKEIKLAHMNPKLYPHCTLSVEPTKKMDYENNYAKYLAAGYYAGCKGIPIENLTGMNILIQGNIPLASGVSSSSALCVCSALAAHYANKVEDFDKKQFIQRVIKAERLVGTASGGMDQSISVLGQLNSCLYIEFNPISGTKVNIPKGFNFIIMNSLVESAKLDTAVFRYNKRVVECRMASKVLAKTLQLATSKVKILKQVQQLANLPLHLMEEVVDTFMDKKPVTIPQIQLLLGCSIQQILNDIQDWKLVLSNNKQYHIYEAAKHVYSQAYRVIQFIEICNSNIQDQQKGHILGRLMNQSQKSCRDIYQCSHPNIDQLATFALQAGAYGSRLTGAGWGGCTVSLVPENKIDHFMKQLTEKYYRQQKLSELTNKFGIQNVMFVTKPSEGACLII